MQNQIVFWNQHFQPTVLGLLESRHTFPGKSGTEDADPPSTHTDSQGEQINIIEILTLVLRNVTLFESGLFYRSD